MEKEGEDEKMKDTSKDISIEEIDDNGHVLIALLDTQLGIKKVGDHFEIDAIVVSPVWLFFQMLSI